MKMPIKTKVLYNDHQAEKLGIDERFIWGDFYLDLYDVVGFGDFVKDGEKHEDKTEVFLASHTIVINMNPAEFANKIGITRAINATEP